MATMVPTTGAVDEYEVVIFAFNNHTAAIYKDKLVTFLFVFCSMAILSMTKRHPASIWLHLLLVIYGWCGLLPAVRMPDQQRNLVCHLVIHSVAIPLLLIASLMLL